ncbi:MAG: DUF885 family protein [Sphingomonadaceae bacterium]
MRRHAAALALAAAIALAAPAAATPSDDFEALTEEYWAWVLRENPAFASMLGVKDHDDRLADISLAAEDRRAAEMEAFLERLEAIPDTGLSPAERTNKHILMRTLSNAIEANSFGQRMMLFTNRSGWHQSFAGLGEQLAFKSREDYENYLKRLAAYPDYNEEAIRISTRAIEEGYTLPCAAMAGFENSISGVIGEDPAATRLYAPFEGDPPPDMNEAEWEAMKTRAAELIGGPVRDAYREHHEWYTREYAPNCNPGVSIAAQPGGEQYYGYRVRTMTTTDLTPEEIHEIGLQEVARIRAEMEKVADEAGFDSREAFIEDLRTNPKYYAKSPEELMEAVGYETKKLDGQMPRLFGLLPRLPYTIREIPPEIAPNTTTAYYNSGSLETGKPGIYYVNTSKLDQRPLWEVPALSVHEAVPGHHHQIALQQELDMPDWRRHGTFFTAFVEGWGLYSESLGEEMGIYDTPAKKMGQLSYEMWRAARLVVDTGIHSKDWSKERAIEFMRDNTALTEGNIEAEVNRYISWPGQALAYKIGELKIHELRDRAQAELGAGFDIRAFHDAVLGRGAVPLDVLEAQVEAWIAAEKAGG